MACKRVCVINLYWVTHCQKSNMLNVFSTKRDVSFKLHLTTHIVFILLITIVKTKLRHANGRNM